MADILVRLGVRADNADFVEFMNDGVQKRRIQANRQIDLDAISEIERLRAMLERVSHLNSFRELNDILPEVRLLLGCPWSTDAERVAIRSTLSEKGE